MNTAIKTILLLFLPLTIVQGEPSPKKRLFSHFDEMVQTIDNNDSSAQASIDALNSYYTQHRSDIKAQLATIGKDWSKTKNEKLLIEKVTRFYDAMEHDTKFFKTHVDKINNAIPTEKMAGEKYLEALKHFHNRFQADFVTLAPFIRKYSTAANQSACTINLTSIHKATRSVQNLDNLRTGSPLSWKMITGKNMPLLEIPKCPAGGTYTLSKTIPAEGKPACTCSHPEHNPKNTTDL